MPADPTGSFQTHAGYLAALNQAVWSRYRPAPNTMDHGQVLRGLATAASTSATVSALRERGQMSADVAQHLRNAWGTELLLDLTGTVVDDELVGMANNWTVVQAYYAIYHVFLAFLAAQGGALPRTHETTQRAYAAFWADRTTDVPPWGLGCGSRGYTNLPAGHAVDETVHPWSTPSDVSCIDISVKAFRTTRDEAVQEAVKRRREDLRREAERAWTSEESARMAGGRRPRKRPSFPLPRLTATERARVLARVRSRTFLDYLWRLRVKANYEDAAMFVDGPTTAIASRAVYRNLREVTAATLCLHEILIRQLAGGTWLRDVARAWCTDHVPSRDRLGVSRRLQLM